ncbi:hypothetical protein AAFF_G00266680 [Aldrovandia affinis]|uniref:Uncharacterized protein n=1 Tax=Aldrovandia affinis TaxID=143900 RepID=A0AAD7RBK7_9TELE|nr:hypothetical protein AAFF_G00266680 [Aldrovandia affinis]
MQEMNVLQDQTMVLNVELQQRQTEQEKLLAQRDDVSSQLQEVTRANSRLLEQLTELGQEKDKLQQELEETRKTAEKSALEHQEQEKAFDRVQHGDLRRMGFGPRFIGWVRTLYAGVYSCVRVNGFLSGPGGAVGGAAGMPALSAALRPVLLRGRRPLTTGPCTPGWRPGRS